MDPAPLAVTAAAALTVLQPYLPVLATKAAEKLGEELPVAVGKIFIAIRTRFDTKATAKETLVDLLKSPSDPDIQGAFRVQLKKAMEEDPAFAAAVQNLLAEAAPAEIYRAELHGDGAIAQGNGAQAVGRGGVIIGGSVGGNVRTAATDPDQPKPGRKS